MVPFSMLDLSPITQGGTVADALHRSLDLARQAEQLGYRRYWVAEHHNMPGIASAATAVVIGHVAAGTSTIRVGSGGIMLPNHSPLVIAEQFGTLAALFPGRIDLGLGRAPGTDPVTARALRRGGTNSADTFPQDVIELQNYFHPAVPGQAVQAVPGAGLEVPATLRFASHAPLDTVRFCFGIGVYEGSQLPQAGVALASLAAAFNSTASSTGYIENITALGSQFQPAGGCTATASGRISLSNIVGNAQTTVFVMNASEYAPGVIGYDPQPYAGVYGVNILEIYLASFWQGDVAWLQQTACSSACASRGLYQAMLLTVDSAHAPAIVAHLQTYLGVSASAIRATQLQNNMTGLTTADNAVQFHLETMLAWPGVLSVRQGWMVVLSTQNAQLCSAAASSVAGMQYVDLAWGSNASTSAPTQSPAEPTADSALPAAAVAGAAFAAAAVTVTAVSGAAGASASGATFAAAAVADAPIAGAPIAGAPVAGVPISGAPVAGASVAGTPVAISKAAAIAESATAT